MVKPAFVPPAECPVCGEPVPPGARACPACGADERSGWDEEAARYDGLDLPDEAFREDGEPAAPPRTGGGRGWFVAAVLVILAFLAVFVLR